jgi:hypothetical protein
LPNDKIYIHELVAIIGHNRANYMRHMTAVWTPVRKAHEQLCLGVWAEVGTTGNWPRTINMWEQKGWEGLAFHLGFEASGKAAPNEEQNSSIGDYEPEERAWWSDATAFRSGGRDRILLPTPWTRTVDELLADGVRGGLYAHERAWTLPGKSQEYLDLVHDLGLAAYAEAGLENIGGYDNALINEREAFVLWAIPDWPAWAAFERAWRSSPALLEFRKASAAMVDRFERRLMTDSPLNPMVLGRQPEQSDA